MAGILNNTARQYNLKCIGKLKNRVTIRVAPGFNDVDDKHWAEFKGDAYVASLKKEGSIDFGAKIDDMLLERQPDTKSKSKSVKQPDKAKSTKEDK